MRLKNIHVRNFRALEEIDVDLESPVSVIVGPNAIGKTTMLEAIRLVKALVAPRSQTESNQALVALGAMLPYNPQRAIPGAIARDMSRQVEIRCRYELLPAESAILTEAAPEVVVDFALRSAGHQFFSPSVSLAYLSSATGQAALVQAEKELREAIEALGKGSRDLFLDLKFDPASGRFDTADRIGGLIFAFLDSRCRPNHTVFSYFPADRALPPGEHPVQLGAADAVQQIESHASQPQLKYSRLKNTIFWRGCRKSS
jgi:hypothetical protein